MKHLKALPSLDPEIMDFHELETHQGQSLAQNRNDNSIDIDTDNNTASGDDKGPNHNHDYFSHHRFAPLFASSVACGFPSPAEDYLDQPLDLNELLIKKPAATFFVRAKGDSMNQAGIFEGDILIIDRSLTPRHGQIVLAVVNGEFTLKRLHRPQASGPIVLQPENPKYPPLKIHEDMDFLIWGVAIHCIHKLT